MKLVLVLALIVAIPINPAAHMQMNERGEKGMGFSQTATTHHFYLNESGGIIQVEANDSGARQIWGDEFMRRPSFDRDGVPRNPQSVR
jgi:hypothetical protein